MGSAMHNVPGSLILGGYDASRTISSPIAVQDDYFWLSDISLGVANGSSAFLNSSSSSSSPSPIPHLLQPGDTKAKPPLSAQPDPAVPYLYLPRTTCDAIAAHLPVTFDANIQLYLWNTSSPAYHAITSSPHYLAFTFKNGSAATPVDIVVPFALLNLTLNIPKIRTDTPYFPCRPSNANSDGRNSPQTVLGRAFLQAAFFARQWETGYSWLAQAPGPGLADEDVRTIAEGATSLGDVGETQVWYESWAEVLRPLEAVGEASDSSSSSSSSSCNIVADSKCFSTEAKVAIGLAAVVFVLVIVAVGCVLRCRWRWRAGLESAPENRVEDADELLRSQLESPIRLELEVPALVHEAEGRMDSYRARDVELPGYSNGR